MTPDDKPAVCGSFTGKRGGLGQVTPAGTGDHHPKNTVGDLAPWVMPTAWFFALWRLRHERF
jgi:hypothetical protein